MKTRRLAASVFAAVLGATVIGCGSEEGSSSAVAETLGEAGYEVDVVDKVSVFGDPESALAVGGNGIPSGAVVAVEFMRSAAEADEVVAGYEEIKDSSVELRGTVVYSALIPVEEDQLEAVVDAASP